jgi:NADH dehydrogenase
MGRVIVGPDLSIPGHPEVFVIGDLARFEQDGKPLPGVAAVAMQQGAYVGRLIRERVEGRPMPPFRYRDRGSLATIGRSAAVADLRGLHFSGYFAWLVWLFVHLMYLVQFANRLLVLMQWAYNYFTRNITARLITNVPQLRIGEPAPSAIEGRPAPLSRAAPEVSCNEPALSGKEPPPPHHGS